MKKTLMVFACTALLAASLSACGSKPAENTDTGTASSAAASSSSSEQQQENTLTGSLDEKKNGMFVVTDAEGASYEFTYDPAAPCADSVALPRLPLGKNAKKSPAGTDFLSPRQGISLFRTSVRPCPDTSDNPPCG